MSHISCVQQVMVDCRYFSPRPHLYCSMPPLLLLLRAVYPANSRGPVQLNFWYLLSWQDDRTQELIDTNTANDPTFGTIFELKPASLISNGWEGCLADYWANPLVLRATWISLNFYVFMLHDMRNYDYKRVMGQ